MNSSLHALNLVESACVGVTSTFMPLLANSLTHSYILVGAIVTGYGLAQALSYTLAQGAVRVNTNIVFALTGLMFLAGFFVSLQMKPACPCSSRQRSLQMCRPRFSRCASGHKRLLDRRDLRDKRHNAVFAHEQT